METSASRMSSEGIGDGHVVGDDTKFPRGLLRRSTLQVKKGFGDSLRDLQGPGMMEVCPISERYQETSVRNSLHFREKPLRVERPAGPTTAPANRENGLLDDFRALSSSIRTIRLRDTPAVWAA